MGHVYRGKRVGVQEYRDHHRHDKRLKYMMAHRQESEGDTNAAPGTQSSLPIVQPTASRPEGSNHNLEETQLVVDRTPDEPEPEGNSIRSYAMPWTSQEDELAGTLEDFASVFQSGLLQLHDIKIDNLVFCEPSKDDDGHIPPPLQSHATTNIQFFQYRDWLIKLRVEAEKLDCGGFERCRRIKHQLLEDLRDEWTKLEKLKCRAWQIVSLRCPSPGPGLTQTIDTCEYHRHLVKIVSLTYVFVTCSTSF
jgi:hypothetical protein